MLVEYLLDDPNFSDDFEAFAAKNCAIFEDTEVRTGGCVSCVAAVLHSNWVSRFSHAGLGVCVCVMIVNS